MKHVFKHITHRFGIQRGFSMVEVLLYLGILIVLISVLTQVFVSLIDIQLETQSSSPIDQDGGMVLSRIEYDVGRASSITTPAQLGDTSDTLQIVIAGENYTYSVSNGNIILTNLQGSDPLNGSESTFSDFTLTKTGNANGKNLLDVSFRVSSKAQETKGPQGRDFSTTVGLR